MDADARGSGSTKRTAPEGTPDREAEARSKMPSTELMPRALALTFDFAPACPKAAPFGAQAM